MHCYDFRVVLQEVPGEISLCFTISGCPLRCAGCHSPFLWKEGSGTKLETNAYKEILHRYFGFATCVVFMGGEWHKTELIQKLKYAREQGYKTCLYTGYEEVDSKILDYLTWIKTGRWDKNLGGLNSKITNQVFREVKTDKKLNYLFITKQSKI
jgi:anaerobic ribonucleoside-triphosphate reductase activating protein